jgi:hypothetical protein
MYHENTRIALGDWFKQEPTREPREALVTITGSLVKRGCRSLELDLSGILREFTSFAVDQTTLSTRELPGEAIDSVTYRRLLRGAPSVYVTCLKADETFMFLDMEPVGPTSLKPFDLEADIFSPSREAAAPAIQLLLEATVECFHLSGPGTELIRPKRVIPSPPKWLAEMAASKPAIDSSLHKRLAVREPREILRALKKRGSILESDLADLTESGASEATIAAVLDEFSAGDDRLVEKKKAIVCKTTNEIIFLLRDMADLESAKNLECPKCSSKITDELVLSYFERTDQLRELFDGNRWMPLLVKDALVEAGIPLEAVHTELKYDQDEIDILALYKGRVLVIEAKDRPFNLNDAYKLSAKTTRLENAALRHPAQVGRPDPEDLESILANLDAPQRKPSYIPVVVSNFDIAKDARDLLTETKDTVRFLEGAEDGLLQFAQALVSNIDDEDTRSRLYRLTGTAASDSISHLAAAQISQAFHSWLQTGNGEK